MRLESAGEDPWAGLPASISPPGPRPSLKGPTLLPPTVPVVFWGEILTEVGSGVYTFKQKVLTDGTTWTDKTGGRTGTCYEANDVAGIAVGKFIEIRVEHDTGGTLRYVFNYGVLLEGDAVWTARSGDVMGHIVLGPPTKTGPNHANCDPTYVWDDMAHICGWWVTTGGGEEWGTLWNKFTEYVAWREYANGVSVMYDGTKYTSLQANNQAHQPDTSPLWWAEA